MSQWSGLSQVLYSAPQILKPSEKKAKYQYQGINRPQTPRGPQNNPGMKRK
jgi:hypothetical protein